MAEVATDKNVGTEGHQGAAPADEPTGSTSVDETTDKLNKAKAGDKPADDEEKFDGNKFAADDIPSDDPNPDDTDPDDPADDPNEDDGGDPDDSDADDEGDPEFSWDQLEDEDPLYDDDPGASMENPTDDEPAIDEPKGENDTAQPASPDDAKENAWKQVAKDLNIEAETYADFVEKVKQSTTETVYVTEDQNLSQINKVLSMTPEDRMSFVLKENYDYTDEEVAEEIQNMKDTKSFNREDKKIQAQFKQQRTKYIEYLEAEKAKKTAAQTEAQKNFTDNLKTSLSKTESILGGSISDTERDAIFNYITSGKLSEELLANHDDLIETAFYRLYRDKIMKIWDAKGVSKGKQNFLKHLSPKRGKRAPNEPVVTDERGEGDGFDPDRFLAGQ